MVTAESGDLAEIAQRVESMGFDSLWIPEHPVIPAHLDSTFPFAPDGKLPDHYHRFEDLFISLTVAAMATKNITIGSGICLLPEREPMVTAKTVASLDRVSGGRLILGVGGGWLREETEAMGASFRLRWKHVRESVEAMRLLWTQREASYDGEIVQFPEVRCEPKPLQKNGPPIFLGAHGHKALERVVRYCDGWYPIVESPQALQPEIAELRRLAQEAGRDPDSIQVLPVVDPEGGNLSPDTLKQYQDCGVNGVVIFNQQMGADMADGKTHQWLDTVAPIVERGHGF